MEYSEEEKQELANHAPSDHRWYSFSESQLELRESMAKRLFQAFIDQHSNLEPLVRQTCMDYPFWGFYQESEDERGIYRVYGVEQDQNGQLYLLAVSAQISMTDTHRLPVHVLKRVDRWSDEKKTMLKFTARPSWFLDPLAFVHWCQHYTSDQEEKI